MCGTIFPEKKLDVVRRSATLQPDYQSRVVI